MVLIQLGVSLSEQIRKEFGFQVLIDVVEEMWRTQCSDLLFHTKSAFNFHVSASYWATEKKRLDWTRQH